MRPIFVLMMPYYFTVGLLFMWVGGMYGFWMEFGIYCFVLSTFLVKLYDYTDWQSPAYT